MSSARFNSIALAMLLIAAFMLRAWQPAHMSVEHFDEGVYASNLFSDHLGFKYPDRQYYAPPLLPAIFEWVLIFSGANPHTVMWVNVVLGTALVVAVFWTTKELSVECRVSSEEELARRAGDVGLSMSPLDQISNTAALAAAAIVAFSDIFIQYSRAALTDIPVCLWMTLAVGAGTRAFRTGSWWWVVASGLLTSLAWWTKYNGWLPLAILGAGLAGWLLFTRPGRASLSPSFPPENGTSSRKKKGTSPPPWSSRPGIRQLLQWGTIAGIAGLLWLPYLSELQPTGGYAAVAANHKGYLVGWSGWGSSALRHLAVDRFYAGGASAFGLFVALEFAWWLIPSPETKRLNRGKTEIRRLTLLGVLALPIIIAMSGGGLIPGLVCCACLIPLSWLWGSSACAKVPLLPLPGWILLAWIAGLTLATPLYRPYPRLILPWLTAMSIATGIGLAFAATVVRQSFSLLSQENTGQANPIDAPPFRKLLLVNAPFGVLISLAILAWALATNPIEFQDRRGLQQAANEIVAAIQLEQRTGSRSSLPELDCVIYVLAEPGLYYHLAAQEDKKLRYITQPASNLGMLTSGKIDPRVPAYLVTGPHSKAESVELAKMPKDQVTQLTIGDFTNYGMSFNYLPSDLVLLDDYPPAELSQHRKEYVQLWRVNSTGRK